MDTNNIWAWFWSAIAFFIPIAYVAIMCRIANPFAARETGNSKKVNVQLSDV